VKIRKIAIDLTPVLPGGDNGGAKVFAIELIKSLARRHPDVEFLLLTSSRSHDELGYLDAPNVSRHPVATASSEIKGGELVRLGARAISLAPARARPLLFRLGYKTLTTLRRRSEGKLLAQLKVDLLFCPFTAPTLAEPGIPIVSTLYDLQYASYPEFFTPAEFVQRDQTFRNAARRSTVLAAISEYSRQAAIKQGGLSADRIRTIQLRMAKRAEFDPQRGAEVLSRLGLTRDGYLIFPANFWRHKNHSVLLMAFGMAIARGLPDDIRLVLTGALNERTQYLQQAAKDLGIGDRVVFPGYVADRDLVALVGQARAVVYPSLFEGFGLPVLEAMALDVPVACSDLTSLPEVAGGAALLFDPRKPAAVADAILRVATDATLRAELVAAGRARSAEYADAGRMADEYWACFEDAARSVSPATQIYGVYSDAWSSDQLYVEVADSVAGDRLELELEAPPSVPSASVRIRSAEGRPAERTIERGGTLLLTRPLNGGPQRLAFNVTPTFRPGGADDRTLGLKVRRCAVVRANADVEILFG